MLVQPRINGLGTSVPSNRLAQADAKEFFFELFREGLEDIDRLITVFDTGLIKTRYMAEPLEWMREDHTFGEKNSLVIKHTTQIAAQAARKAIEKARVLTKDISILVFVSSSCVATPSLDALLIQEIGLSRHTAREPMVGLGCAGGVAGLSLAADLARSHPGQNVLFVAAELNSLTFQRSDLSRPNLVSTSLFGDGAAAVVLNTWGNGPKLIGSHNTLLPKTEWVMGWDIIETGLKVRIAADIPAVVLAQLPQLFEDACDKWGVSRQQIKHFILHPGGAKVLDGFVQTLDLTEQHLTHSSGVLRDYGNMSSPTVLFVLDHFINDSPKKGEYGLMVGFGPGFSADQALLQW